MDVSYVPELLRHLDTTPATATAAGRGPTRVPRAEDYDYDHLDGHQA